MGTGHTAVLPEGVARVWVWCLRSDTVPELRPVNCGVQVRTGSWWRTALTGADRFRSAQQPATMTTNATPPPPPPTTTATTTTMTTQTQRRRHRHWQWPIGHTVLTTVALRTETSCHNVGISMMMANLNNDGQQT